MEEKPETEERAESEPTSLEGGESTERGEGPRDQPADVEQLHGVPTDRERDEER
ncbi:MAG: hypothetical protein ACJ752_05865 [Gaiellaceae bacterium]